MVARINTGKSISKSLNYNEQKVKTGAAELLFASGFIKASEKLSFYDKMKQFNRHITLNERATINTLHVSLNFDIADQLTKEKLIAISERYMNSIGFGDQPYLVYRHLDSGHPHIHIVSTNIKKDGKRISLHNLGRDQSETARKMIEKDFSLIPAESKRLENKVKIQPINAQKVILGKHLIKPAISNVLNSVIHQYQFSSLPELNAILGLYNVNAYRGEKDSNIFKNNGLIYRVLDEKGIAVGPPIKASSFHLKPTLAFLEKKFQENDPLKQPAAKRFKVEIEFALAKAGQTSLASFIQELEKGQINTVLRQNKEGLIYGITYVDHKTKTVFNGCDLGKEYSAKGILERLGLKENEKFPSIRKAPLKSGHHTSLEDQTSQSGNNLVELLLQPEQNANAVPYPFKKDAKKKKRKRISL